MSVAPTKEVVIKPNTSWIHIDVEGLIAYKDLLWLLVRRDFVAKYKQTVLGPIWFFANPIITTLVFTVVFSGVMKVATDGTPPILFYMSGMLGWNYFSTVLSGTSNSLAGNTHLFAKVYFPRLIPPLATTISSIFALLIQLVTFFVFYAHYKWNTDGGATIAQPSILWLGYLGVTLHMAILALGIGLILSAMSAKYRDLQQVQAYLINLLMYVTPVIYPLSRIPEKYQWIANINPMTAIVEATRSIFLGSGLVSLPQYAASLLVSFVILGAGIFAYQRSARTFVDTV